MATFIPATDDPTKTLHVSAANGRAFTLQELQGFVGGYIEAVRLNHGNILWVNEEGKLQGLPINVVATLVARAERRIAPGESIVGNALLASAQESGENPGLPIEEQDSPTNLQTGWPFMPGGMEKK